EVEQRERPHWVSASELHPLVDIVERTQTVLVRTNGIEQIRYQQPIDDESGTVWRRDRLLAQRPGKGKHGLVSLIARGQRPDDLDQLHQRHRIEEMKSAESIRP